MANEEKKQDIEMKYDVGISPFDEDPELFATSKEPEIITESDLRSFFHCPHEYYLRRHVGMDKVPRTATEAASLLFSNKRRALFQIRDPVTGRIFPDQTRAGPELKTVEEMDKNELQTYLAFGGPEKFGNYLYGWWLQIGQKDEYAGKPITWRHGKEPFKELL